MDRKRQGTGKRPMLPRLLYATCAFGNSVDIHKAYHLSEKKQKFEAARKKHYNMKQEIQRAKELMAKENAESTSNDND